MVTRPKEIEPFHMLRMVTPYLVAVPIPAVLPGLPWSGNLGAAAGPPPRQAGAPWLAGRNGSSAGRYGGGYGYPP
jgi:hypothetical protein